MNGLSVYFEVPLFVSKMAACPSSGKLEQQRGSPICFHYGWIPSTDDDRTDLIKRPNQHPVVHNDPGVIV